MRQSQTMNSGTDLSLTSVSFVPLPRELSLSRDDSAITIGIEPVDWVLEDLRHPLVETARRIRRIGPTDEAAVVLLSGSAHGAGCSTVALALAAAAAEEMTVLLVDADLGNPGLSRLLASQTANGWEDSVRGICSFQKPMSFADQRNRVKFLPLRDKVVNTSDLLDRPALRVWMNQLRGENSLIVVDGGALSGSACLWAPWVDGAVLVCDSRNIPSRDWSLAWDCLEGSGTHVLGVVETFV